MGFEEKRKCKICGEPAVAIYVEDYEAGSWYWVDLCRGCRLRVIGRAEQIRQLIRPADKA